MRKWISVDNCFVWESDSSSLTLEPNGDGSEWELFLKYSDLPDGFILGKIKLTDFSEERLFESAEYKLSEAGVKNTHLCQMLKIAV